MHLSQNYSSKCSNPCTAAFPPCIHIFNISHLESSPLSHLFPPQPVPEELQSGPGFGYVVAFRPLGAQGWMQAAVTSPDASRYVFKNESIPPFSAYQVKVGVYNNKGEGPFSPVTTIHSAEEGGYYYSYRQWVISFHCGDVGTTLTCCHWLNTAPLHHRIRLTVSESYFCHSFEFQF